MRPQEPENRTPWQDQRPPQHPARLLLWLGLLALGGFVIWRLSALFPGAVSSDYEQARLIQLIALLALLSAGAAFAPRNKWREAARNIAIWVAIAAVLVIGLSFRGEIEAIAMRVRSELVPGYALETGEHEITVTESDGGSFYIIGQVNGVPVRFLIDTGASDTVLSPSDAARLGIDVRELDFSRIYETANGAGRGASYIIDELTVGPIAIANMPISVNQAEMSSSLLGMTFLRRLRSFEVQGRRLVLRY